MENMAQKNEERVSERERERERERELHYSQTLNNKQLTMLAKFELFEDVGRKEKWEKHSDRS